MHALICQICYVLAMFICTEERESSLIKCIQIIQNYTMGGLVMVNAEYRDIMLLQLCLNCPALAFGASQELCP